MTTMIGKTNNKSLKQLFDVQVKNQNELIRRGAYDRFTLPEKLAQKAPIDDVSLSSYHIQQLISEIGEVLEADKRWKSHRNDKYDKDNKLEEIADCFIVLMNVAMFSGFDGDDLTDMIEKKLDIVSKRVSGL